MNLKVFDFYPRTVLHRSNSMKQPGFNINTHFTRFIPVYAVPKSDNSVVTNNVIFCNSQGKAVLEYSLECLDGGSI